MAFSGIAGSLYTSGIQTMLKQQFICYIENSIVIFGTKSSFILLQIVKLVFVVCDSGDIFHCCWRYLTSEYTASSLLVFFLAVLEEDFFLGVKLTAA